MLETVLVFDAENLILAAEVGFADENEILFVLGVLHMVGIFADESPCIVAEKLLFDECNDMIADIQRDCECCPHILYFCPRRKCSDEIYIRTGDCSDRALVCTH